MEQTQQKSPGKGLGVAGFVISLVALVLWLPISGMAILAAALGGGMGLAGFWLVLSLTGLILSIMGFMKANKAGAKKGLAIAGLVLGILATLLSVKTTMGVSTAQTELKGAGDKFKDALEQGLNQSLDSLSNEMKNASDSIK